MEACSATDAVLVVGDLNSKDDQVLEMCKKNDCREARYAGASWGARGNRYYAELKYIGGGFRYDRVLFRGAVWAEAHLVGQSKVFLDGLEFYRSDHFGLLACVDVCEAYASVFGGDDDLARSRRGVLVQLKEDAMQKEQVEARALLQLGGAGGCLTTCQRP